MKVLSALVACTFLLLAGCSSGDSRDAQQTSGQAEKAGINSDLPTNAELKIGTSQEFENLNPIIMSMQATTYIYKFVNRNLTTMDWNNEWVPQIITRIPTLENGMARIETIDGKETLVVDWEIKEGTKWGDGTDVTGHDVKFSWRVARAKTVSVGSRIVYSMLEKIDIDPDNPRKFTFYYDKIRWDFNHNGTLYLLPRHLEEEVFDQYEEINEGYAKNSLYTTDPTNPGLYCGPYRVHEIKLGSHVSLVPNEHFNGKKPAIQKIVLMYLPDTSTLEANLRSGTIDMISVLGLKLDQALKFEKTVLSNNLPYDVNFVPGLVYEHIDLQLSNPILQDKRVRQALVYGINRDELTKSLFEDRQKKAISNVSPVDKEWYTDDPNKIVLYEYSRSKANELLDAAGWTMQDDGYRYKDGEKLSFVLMTTAGDKTRELVQVVLKSQWKKVGVDITIKNEPARVYFGETTRKSKYPGMAMYAWISSPENTPRSTLHSENIPTADNGWSGQNTPRWSNPQVDQILNDIETELDADKRREMIHRILYHYTEEVPVIPLYYRANISVTPKNLTGYKLTSHQFSSPNHVEYWSLDDNSAVSHQGTN